MSTTPKKSRRTPSLSNFAFSRPSTPPATPPFGRHSSSPRPPLPTPTPFQRMRSHASKASLGGELFRGLQATGGRAAPDGKEGEDMPELPARRLFSNVSDKLKSRPSSPTPSDESFDSGSSQWWATPRYAHIHRHFGFEAGELAAWDSHAASPFDDVDMRSASWSGAASRSSARASSLFSVRSLARRPRSRSRSSSRVVSTQSTASSMSSLGSAAQAAGHDPLALYMLEFWPSSDAAPPVTAGSNNGHVAQPLTVPSTDGLPSSPQFSFSPPPSVFHASSHHRAPSQPSIVPPLSHQPRPSLPRRVSSRKGILKPSTHQLSASVAETTRRGPQLQRSREIKRAKTAIGHGERPAMKGLRARAATGTASSPGLR